MIVKKRVLIVLVCFFSVLNSYSQIPKNGLVGFWPFNGNANDESGNGNNGIINGAILSKDRFGETEKAYQFDGKDDFIEVAHSNVLNTMPMTVSFWLKVNGSLQNAVFLKKYCCATWNGWTTEIYDHEIPSLECAYYISTCNGIYQTYCSPVPFITKSMSKIKDGNWHQLLFTIDTKGENVYLDTELIHSQSWYKQSVEDNSIASTVNLPHPLSIGGHNQSSRYLNGNLDDIAIWNRVLSKQEITEVFNAKKADINQLQNDYILSFFPNPAKTEINIEIKPILVGSDYSICDISGKKVLSGTLNNENSNIKIQDLQAGSYVFLINENLKYNFNIVKD